MTKNPLLVAQAEEKINVEFEKLVRNLKEKFPIVKDVISDGHLLIWKTCMQEGFRLGFLFSNQWLLEEVKNVGS